MPANSMSRVFLKFLIVTFLITCRLSTANSQEKTLLFDELCQIVEDNFYSPKKIKTIFLKVKPTYRIQISGVSDQREFAGLVNRMLSELKTSHTTYYPPNDPGYYQLASIFEALPNIQELFDGQEIIYPSIGILTKVIEDKVFIISVLAGSPADSAGVLRGDELVAVDDLPYNGISNFKGKTGHPVILTLRRYVAAEPLKIEVIPELVNPKKEFLAAEIASIRVIEQNDHKIGYIHIWSYTGLEYHEAFVEAISSGALKDADALIWDLRDGWGGASASYLNIFNKKVPVYTGIDRVGKEYKWDSQWRKPVVMLINSGVRSGKEILAYGFKKYRLGEIIGEPTAGAVTAGKLFILSDKSLLYLAVGASRIDGEELEGRGVEPDLLVPMDIRYLAGKDLQLEKAMATLGKILDQ